MTSDQSMQIIHVTSDNQACLDRVAPGVFDEPVKASRLALLLAQPNQLLWVATQDGLVVGQILGMIHHHPDKPSELYIDDLGVSPEWCRQGIATGLFNALIQSGQSMGCETVWLATEADNAAAIGLYQSLGLSSNQCMLLERDL